MVAMFVNLPVTDLERATAFYRAIGFGIDPRFSGGDAACVIVEEGHSCVMLLTREFFQTMTALPIGDPAVNPSAAIAVFLGSREEVDAAVAAGVAAGGSEPAPAADHGFMYQRGLTDPDGNVVDLGWMDPAGPEAAAG